MLALEVAEAISVIAIEEGSSSGVGGLLLSGKDRGHGGSEVGVFSNKTVLTVAVSAIPNTAQAPDGVVFGPKSGANGGRADGWG